MRLIKLLVAPFVLVVAKALFRFKLLHHSRLKHKIVMKMFRFCADQGLTDALSLYGHILHFRGEGVANRIQGAIYLERAAKQGEAKAQYQAGRVYEYGFEHYFSSDTQLAFRYYENAATQGHLLAIKRMVKVYERGELHQQVDASKCAVWKGRLEEAPTIARLGNAVIS